MSDAVSQLAANLQPVFGDRLRGNAGLAPHTTFGIGGPADLLLAVETETELLTCLALARELSVPCTVIGGGSNILVRDAGVRGLVVLDRNSSLRITGNRITVASGTAIARVAMAAAAAGLAGLECAGNLYGTVGGAVFGNAGAYGTSVGAVLASARVVTATGEVLEVDRDYFDFDYRSSSLRRNRSVLLAAEFVLGPGDSGQLQMAMIADRTLRLERHPQGYGTAGSYFRNLPPAPGSDRRRAVGELLDRVGAKRMNVGGAAVFAGHANFIINRGGATARDVTALTQQLRERVASEFAVTLTEEVVIIGED